VLNGNESTDYPTKNKLVRQAIAAAIDRHDIAQRVYMGTVEPLYSLVPMGMWSHIDVFKEKYGDGNIELAKQLLQQAGYSEDNKLKLELWWTPTHYGDTEKDLAQVLKEQLEKTGMIEVELKSAEWSTYVDYSRKGAMMASLFGWYPDYLDPDDYTTPFLKSTANSWLGYPYSDPEMDKLLEKASVALTQEEREQLYKQIQQKLAEDAPIIPLVQGKLYVVAKKDIDGIILDPTMQFRYWLLEWKS
jgi:peptide/nickel transport system substrate-binding protein